MTEVELLRTMLEAAIEARNYLLKQRFDLIRFVDTAIAEDERDGSHKASDKLRDYLEAENLV